MNESYTPNADAIARFAGAYREREYPAQVVDAAKQCLVDWFGVCLGALDDPAAAYVQRIVDSWRSAGNASLLTGGRGAPVLAALVNGTLSHCLDYDDTHIESILHGSGPTWAAALAVGTDRGSEERDVLAAFITGFEVGARIGNRGVGVRLNHNGWHASCTLGRFSSAIAAGALLGLDERRIPHVLGTAATQVGGLTASIGSMAKPFQVGKAASDGVLAAELAAAGFEATTSLLDSDRGLLPTLFQDSSARVPPLTFDEGWEITRNSFKPYAACQLTHASIDSARRLGKSI
jgi:2-methylcitrate dehydratase PrpD